MIKTGKFLRGLICWLSVLLALGLAGGCAKKLLPPEIDASADASSALSDGGAGQFPDFDGSSRDGDGGSRSGDGVILSDETLKDSDTSFPPTGDGFDAGDGAGTGDDGTDFGSGISDSDSQGAFDGSGESTAALKIFRETNDLKDVYFEFDQYALSEKGKTVLQENVAWLKKNPGVKVEIQGHCDERGTNNYNLGLGDRRALVSKKYMVVLGIEEDRLFTISYGEEKPFCFESTKDCWRSNRRDHFMVSE